MIGLILVGLALLAVPVLLLGARLVAAIERVVQAIERDVDGEVTVKVAARKRTLTAAAPRAKGRPTDPAQSYDTHHPHADTEHPHGLGTWGTTTPETGVTRRKAPQGD